MYELADAVRSWQQDGRPVRLIRLVATRGVSSRWPGAAVALCDGRQAGTLLAGALDERLPGLAGTAGPAGLRTVELADGRAQEAGLSCGGQVDLFVQDAADVPAAAWQRLVARQPVTLITDLATGATGVADDDRIAVTQVRVDERSLLAAYRPTPRLVVVGEGLIADRLGEFAALLSWELGGSVAALGPGDALVVLSHDENQDVPALAAALGQQVGYIGALGSRRTQDRRAGQLRGRGVDPARVHGPAGLDIGSATPAEVALAIVAEALATLRHAPGGALRDRPGPVHAG